MYLVMNERSLGNKWRDVFRGHTPTADWRRRPPRSTNGGMTCDRFHRDWFAQRAWEDDGGQIGQELIRVTG